MAQCRNCMKEVSGDARFCDRCGAPLNAPPPQYQQPYQGYPQAYTPYPITAKMKEPVLALILSLFIPGIGQIYAGKLARGLTIFILFPISIAISMIMQYVIVWSWDPSSSPTTFPALLWVFVIFWIVMAVVWIWQVVDAYKLTERYNDELMRTGRAPW